MNVTMKLASTVIAAMCLGACGSEPATGSESAAITAAPSNVPEARFRMPVRSFPPYVVGQRPLLHGASDADHYVVVDLGPTDLDSHARGINEQGQVVGYDAGPGMTRGWIWTHGAREFVPGFGGAFSVANGINNTGDVVGYASFPGDTVFHAYRLSHGTMTDLLTLGGQLSFASSINDAGQIVGDSYTGNDPASDRAFLWQGGSMRDIGSLGGGQSGAAWITQTGYVTGVSRTNAGDRHAFLWDGDTMFDIGTLGGTESFGAAKNDAGLIVGESMTASLVTHAFSWQYGEIHDLGTLGGTRSSALGVNEDGLIVGQSDVAVGSAVHATRWHNGVIVDLNTLVDASDWTLIEARAVNTRGQIIGSGQHGAHIHAFLLNPE